MVDEAFIEHTIQSSKRAKDKVLEAFRDISVHQFNWNPSLESWSIAQCLEHLVISDSTYSSDLQKIIEGKYTMTFWEKYSPFTAKCGQILKDRLQEQVKKKMITPKKLRPMTSEKEFRLHRHLH